MSAAQILTLAFWCIAIIGFSVAIYFNVKAKRSWERAEDNWKMAAEKWRRVAELRRGRDR